MYERLNPRVYFAFKKIFGSEENKDILIALVNAVLPEEDQVQSITLTNPDTLKNRESDRTAILDIRAIDQEGKPVNIEMQVADELDYEQRALFLWSEVYREQLQSGDDYNLLQRTISIHILNFTLMDEPDYHNHYGIANKKSGKEAFTDLQLHTVELNKFESSTQKDLKTALNRWATFLTKAQELSTEKLPKEMKADKAIVKALDVLQTTALTDEEYTTYKSHQAWARMERSIIAKARYKGESKGLAKGMKKGIKKGMEKGLAKGLEKGKAEGKKETQLTIAKKMLASGIALDQVMKLTGLSKDEIAS